VCPMKKVRLAIGCDTECIEGFFKVEKYIKTTIKITNSIECFGKCNQNQNFLLCYSCS